MGKVGPLFVRFLKLSRSQPSWPYYIWNIWFACKPCSCMFAYPYFYIFYCKKKQTSAIDISYLFWHT